MKSNISKKSLGDLVKAARAMSPQERLLAFLNHNRLICQFHEAGKAFRKNSLLRKNHPIKASVK